MREIGGIGIKKEKENMAYAKSGNRMDERYVEPGVPVKAKGKTRYLVMVLRAKS